MKSVDVAAAVYNFTALHGMQTRYSDEKAVRLSVPPSVRLLFAALDLSMLIRLLLSTKLFRRKLLNHFISKAVHDLFCSRREDSAKWTTSSPCSPSTFHFNTSCHIDWSRVNINDFQTVCHLNMFAEKHDIARHAFLNWVQNGKPKCGPSFQYMYKSRACFKQALQYCKRHKEQIQADALASRYSNMQAKQFWNDVSKSANRKATKYVNKIGNAVGEENICHTQRALNVKVTLNNV